jgi:hypothetical protein
MGVPSSAGLIPCMHRAFSFPDFISPTASSAKACDCPSFLCYAIPRAARGQVGPALRKGHRQFVSFVPARPLLTRCRVHEALRTTPGVALGIAQIGSGSHLPRKGCTTSNVTMLSATQAPTIATTIAAAFSQRLIAMGTSHCRAGPPQLAASFIAARNGVTSSVMLVSDFGPLRATLTPDDVAIRYSSRFSVVSQFEIIAAYPSSAARPIRP